MRDAESLPFGRLPRPAPCRRKALSEAGQAYLFGKEKLVRMELKKSGLLEGLISNAEGSKSICETCGHLVQAGKTALGCTAHDKLIMPEYPPYSGNAKCSDWKKKAEI